MPSYRRLYVPGGSYFFTARLQDRHSDLLVRDIDRLRKATRVMLDSCPTRIDAIVVLPNAIHTIWTLPPGDADFSRRWSILKTHFSRALPAPKDRGPSHQRSRDKGLWQRRFWEHCLTGPQDYETHKALIYNAPVTLGLVDRPEAWPHTSLHRDRLLIEPHAMPRAGPRSQTDGQVISSSGA